MTEPRRPGRPRIHDTPADRVRAHRERKRQEAATANLPEMTVPADPEIAATTLVEALPLLRREAEVAVTRLTAVAQQIAAAVDVLGDDTALDTHLRRAQTEAAKVRADADAELAAMREQLESALADRENADAAADAADTELARATGEHADAMQRAAQETAAEQLRIATEHAATLDLWKADRETAAAEHTAKVAELHTTIEQAQNLLGQAESERVALTEQLEQARTAAERAQAAAERDAAAAGATITRLESDLTAQREAVAAERDRTDTVREDLAAARVELAEARAQTAAVRDRAAELRTELGALRGDRT